MTFAQRVARRGERQLPWWLQLLLVGLAATAELAWWVLRSPWRTAGVAAAAAVWWIVDVGAAPYVAGAVTVLLIATGTAWELAPSRFVRLQRLCVAGWRRWRTDRRWDDAMHAAGLTYADLQGTWHVPRLLTVRIRSTDPAGAGPPWDVNMIRVETLPGQLLEDWRKASPRLASALGGRRVRVHRDPGSTRVLTLHLFRARPGERAGETGVQSGDQPSTPVDNAVGEQPATPAAGAFPRAPRGQEHR